MVDINPMLAIRPQSAMADKIVSFPYDVMDRDEARQMAQNNPSSFLRIIRSDLEFGDEVDPYSDQVYARAVSNLEDFIQKGWLVREDVPCYYVYRLQSGKLQQTGLVAGSSIFDYQKDKIKKHEFTRPDKEIDRTTHIDKLGANTGPVFLLYNNQSLPELEKKLNHIADTQAPLYDVTFEDKVRHQLFRIEPGQTQNDFTRLFAQLDATYIADGHHRAASAVKNGLQRQSQEATAPSNYFLSVIFPDSQLSILPYNRVVNDLNNHTPQEFLDLIQTNFDIKEGKGTITGSYDINMYLVDKWYFLTAEDHTWEGKNETDRLAVGVLQDVLLKPVLNIEDPRTSERIKFVGGIRGDQELEKLVNSKKFMVAFSMPPVTTQELIEIADAGRTMPPKSTWFEPKLRSGFVIHMLDNPHE